MKRELPSTIKILEAWLKKYELELKNLKTIFFIHTPTKNIWDILKQQQLEHDTINKYWFKLLIEMLDYISELEFSMYKISSDMSLYRLRNK